MVILVDALHPAAAGGRGELEMKQLLHAAGGGKTRSIVQYGVAVARQRHGPQQALRPQRGRVQPRAVAAGEGIVLSGDVHRHRRLTVEEPCMLARTVPRAAIVAELAHTVDQERAVIAGRVTVVASRTPAAV